LSEKTFIDFIESYRSLTVVSDSSLDSLLSAGILFKNLSEHGWDVRVNLDPKILVDYRDDPAILLNLKPLNAKKQITLSTTTSSVTALVVTMLEKSIGSISKWDKVLALLSALYRGYYDFKAGSFLGVENTIFSELSTQKIFTEVVGLRLWGAKRRNLVAALTRTLIPFIPGITGNVENATKVVREVYGVNDPLSVKQKELTSDEDVKRISDLIKRINEISQHYVKKDLQLQLKLVGDFYMYIQVHGVVLELEAYETLGNLVVYGSMCKNCPLDLVLTPLSIDMLSQIFALCSSSLDYLAISLSNQIVEFLRDERSIFECEDSMQRPDLVIDILLYHGIIPRDRPIKLLCNGEEMTTLRELLRLGVKPEEAYSKCTEDQLCKV
jgi:single-stranded-DNA-specific exonuclease